MKKYVLAGMLILALVLSSCTPGGKTSPFSSLSPRECAEKFFAEADSIYYENGSLELYGETLTNLVPAVDSMAPDLTNGLSSLREFDFSAYEETFAAAGEGESGLSFWVGAAQERCKITLEIQAPAAADMAIRFSFADGRTYHLTGPYSAGLYELADAKTSAFTNMDAVDGNLRVTPLTKDGREPYIIQRGVSGLIHQVFELTADKTRAKKMDNAVFDLKLEVIGGPTYLCNSEQLYFKDASDTGERVYVIKCEEDTAQLLRMILG